MEFLDVDVYAELDIPTAKAIQALANLIYHERRKNILTETYAFRLLSIVKDALPEEVKIEVEEAFKGYVEAKEINKTAYEEIVKRSKKYQQKAYANV